MPSRLPDERRPRAKAAAPEPDWLALWALSMGFSAAFIAAVAYFSAGDKFGASFVLFGGAVLIALVLVGSHAPRPSDD